MAQVQGHPTEAIRVAVEGCGHGTLHAIYASTQEACRVKGWDGVDLLIIGGDFQAVRNQHDLNVTSMPPKYRRMADFHEYYSGARVAPYLTVFIGGNHEASNHLFELYYGGWVAPNIYYLGAANVIQLGPLRIAGLTGIWKPYDYPKAHFERLPYNQEEIGSIYHVRELDARKLLSLRTQVDIGLSHDWPSGIEMLGDYKWLFKNKSYFLADSKSGKLGSVAAKQCLERLRPPYWFSAHLHTKYTAIVQHGESEGTIDAAIQGARRIMAGSGQADGQRRDEGPRSQNPNSLPVGKREDRPQVSAWQQFHLAAKKADTEERDEILREREKRREEEKRTGIRKTAQYTIDETFHQVGVDGSAERKIVSTTTHKQVNNRSPSDSPEPIPNLDGCGFSRPNKRQRVASPPKHDDDRAAMESPAQLDGAGASVIINRATPRSTANPDAINIDLSDEDDTIDDQGPTHRAQPIVIIDPALLKPSQNSDARRGDLSNSMSEESDDGGVKLNPQAASFTPSAQPEPTIALEKGSTEDTPVSSRRSSDSDLNPEAKAFEPKASTTTINTFETAVQSPGLPSPALPPQATTNKDNEVSEEMRAQLAALSSNFTSREDVTVSPSLPFPKEITNKTTHFLALGKCEAYQEFLQLLEIKSITKPKDPITRPLKLSYDPEWLAIQRVFASELHLGGLPTDKAPVHLGESHYHDQILKEQAWVTKNIVEPGRLQVPDNFSLTAAVYDPEAKIGPYEMPREMTNPQTSTYCALIGIENKFDASEEERDFRVQQGPRPESHGWTASRENRRGGGGSGHHGGGGRGRGGGHGHGQRGGRGGGRGGGGGGGGGGRGRGRGRW